MHIIIISNCTLYIVKFFIRFDTLFLPDFCRFSERGVGSSVNYSVNKDVK